MRVVPRVNGLANRRTRLNWGMKLTDVLSLVTESRIQVDEVDFGAVVMSEGDWKKYIAKPNYPSEDALVMFLKLNQDTKQYELHDM